MLDKRKMQEFIPKDTKTRIWDHKRGREGGSEGVDNKRRYLSIGIKNSLNTAPKPHFFKCHYF